MSLIWSICARNIWGDLEVRVHSVNNKSIIYIQTNKKLMDPCMIYILKHFSLPVVNIINGKKIFCTFIFYLKFINNIYG